MKKTYRAIFYFLGLLILALGLTLNAKSGLGVGPIVTISFTISQVFDISFGNATLGLYLIFVFLQFIIKGKNRKIIDLLQILVSIIFTRFLNIFGDLININNDAIWMKFSILGLAIICTGVGAAMNVNTRLVSNPGDSIVQAISDRSGREMGFVKNIFDVCCITIAIVIGFVFEGKLVGVGIGTVISMICVGRIIWIFNKFFREKMEKISGIDLSKYKNNYKNKNIANKT